MQGSLSGPCQHCLLLLCACDLVKPQDHEELLFDARHFPLFNKAGKPLSSLCFLHISQNTAGSFPGAFVWTLCLVHVLFYHKNYVPLEFIAGSSREAGVVEAKAHASFDKSSAVHRGIESPSFASSLSSLLRDSLLFSASEYIYLNVT